MVTLGRRAICRKVLIKSTKFNVRCSTKRWSTHKIESNMQSIRTRRLTGEQAMFGGVLDYFKSKYYWKRHKVVVQCPQSELIIAFAPIFVLINGSVHHQVHLSCAPACRLIQHLINHIIIIWRCHFNLVYFFIIPLPPTQDSCLAAWLTALLWVYGVNIVCRQFSRQFNVGWTSHETYCRVGDQRKEKKKKKEKSLNENPVILLRVLIYYIHWNAVIGFTVEDQFFFKSLSFAAILLNFKNLAVLEQKL